MEEKRGRLHCTGRAICGGFSKEATTWQYFPSVGQTFKQWLHPYLLCVHIDNDSDMKRLGGNPIVDSGEINSQCFPSESAGYQLTDRLTEVGFRDASASKIGSNMSCLFTCKPAAAAVPLVIEMACEGA